MRGCGRNVNIWIRLNRKVSFTTSRRSLSIQYQRNKFVSKETVAMIKSRPNVTDSALYVTPLAPNDLSRMINTRSPLFNAPAQSSSRALYNAL